MRFHKFVVADGRQVFLPIDALIKLACGLALGLALFFLSVSNIAYQDLAGFGAGPLPPETRWTAHREQVPTGSVHTAGLVAGDVVHASITHRTELRNLDGRSMRHAVSRAGNVEPTPPTRINRALKGDRVVSASVKRPPAHFSAGSVIPRSGLLINKKSRSRGKQAFRSLRKSLAPIKVARAFFHRKPAMRKNKLRQANVLLARGANRLRGVSRSSPTTLVAFAPVDDAKEKPFESLFRNKLGRGDHRWAAKKLPKGAFSKRQQRCLAIGIYFEARGESTQGQAAVAQVILNRVKNPAYPNSICGVVYQNKSWKNRCQFSFACDGVRDRIRSKKHWSRAVAVASKVTSGKSWNKAVGSSTHYHATYVRPRWAKAMKKMKKIGRHIFYRTKRGGWS